MTRKQWGISLLVVGVLGMQASTFVTGTWIWPFMAYCMYTQVNYGTPSTVVIDVTAVFVDGREMLITPEAAGQTWHGWHRNFQRPMMAGDAAIARAAADRIAAIHGQAVRALRLEITRYRIMPDAGLVTTPSTVAYELTATPGKAVADDRP